MESLSRLALTGMVIDERCTAQDLEGSGCGLFEVLSWQLDGGTEENHVKQPSGVPAEIRTEHLQHVCNERCCYANQLDFERLSM
jgi:hypothetical protein